MLIYARLDPNTIYPSIYTPTSRQQLLTLPLHPLRLNRPFRLRRQPRQMPPLPILPIQNRRMRRNPVIPHDNRSRLPFNPGLQILAQRYMVQQELQQVVTLLFLQTDDATRELRVDEECFLACRGVRAD